MRRSNTVYLLRHAHTEVDSGHPVSSWSLSSKGLEQARAAKDAIGLNFDSIYSSSEKKAIQTAEIFLPSPENNILTNHLLNELNRDAGPFMTSEDYKKAVKFALENPEHGVHHWEPARNAYRRFLQGIKQIEEENAGAIILVVSHGLVLSLFFAYALGQIESIYKRWRKLESCSWGIMKNSTIIKDIVI